MFLPNDDFSECFNRLFQHEGRILKKNIKELVNSLKFHRVTFFITIIWLLENLKFQDYFASFTFPEAKSVSFE
jgi:hypothetical protein